MYLSLSSVYSVIISLVHFVGMEVDKSLRYFFLISWLRYLMSSMERWVRIFYEDFLCINLLTN